MDNEPTNPKNEPEKNSSQSCTDKATGVTVRNYFEKAKAFMTVKQASHGGEFGVTIDPIGYPQQWGAWLGYFKSIKKPTKFMTERGKQFARMPADRRQAECCYQVPASMPSDFDGDREWFFDNQAGDDFMGRQSSIRARPELTEEQRRAVVERALKGMGLNRNLDWRPGQ